MNHFPNSLPTSRRAAALGLALLMGLSTGQAQTTAKPSSTPAAKGRSRPSAAATPQPAAKAKATPTPTPADPATIDAPASANPDVVPTESTGIENAPATPAASPASTETEILASQGASFASKDRIAIFNGDVRVHDPKFQLAADKLTVFLNKGADKTAPAAATPKSAAPPPLAATGGASPAPGDKQNSGGGGIDHAIAEGHVIIVQERPPTTPGGETKRSVGRADEADFDNKTGDMVLKGTPSVEQNGNSHVATSPDTVMTLRRDNSLTTVGPSRTLITQRKGNDMSFGPDTGAAGGGNNNRRTNTGSSASPSPSASPTTH